MGFEPTRAPLPRQENTLEANTFDFPIEIRDWRRIPVGTDWKLRRQKRAGQTAG
jgi:hypothetical protein